MVAVRSTRSGDNLRSEALVAKMVSGLVDEGSKAVAAAVLGTLGGEGGSWLSKC